MACEPQVDTFTEVPAELDVTKKYSSLMDATLAEGSLYMRAKDTIATIFNDLQMNETEKAKLTAEYVSQMSIGLSSTSMQTALAWAKEDRDGRFDLALVRAKTEVSLAEKEVMKMNICKAEKDTEAVCAQIEATVAGSIRDNGKVAQYDANNPCKPTDLVDEGLKYEQIQQVRADTYRIFGDAYRKSGVVMVGVDTQDQVKKGLSGDEDGYTWQQQENAERQRIAYEDSKISHAANSSSSMIGQMLTAEIAPNESDVQRWRDAVDRLLQKHSTTSSN